MTESLYLHNASDLHNHALTTLIQAAGMDVANALVHSGPNGKTNSAVINSLMQQVAGGATAATLNLQALGANEGQLKLAAEYRAERAKIGQSIASAEIQMGDEGTGGPAWADSVKPRPAQQPVGRVREDGSSAAIG